jgi:hypothetical protein
MPLDYHTVLSALYKAWSKDSAKQWTANNPANGQCNVTAILIQELYGGEIVKTPLPEGRHFYNRIEGQRFDFTKSQFDEPIDYVDIVTTRDDAKSGATEAELEALKSAFLREIGTME